MRITTSPYVFSSKGFSSNTVSPLSYTSHGTRSSSLTNSDIMHKRLVSDRQSSQNSYLLMNDSSKYQSPIISKQLIQKNITNEYGIVENSINLQQKINGMAKTIQQISKKLSKQGQEIKTLQNNSNQNQVKGLILQKVHQQIQVKVKEGTQVLLRQINQINTQINQRIDQIKILKLAQINNGSMSILNQSGLASNNQKPVNYQLLLKKIKLTIDQKLSSQIFKIRLFVENQIFKSTNLIKNVQNTQSRSIFTKSTLKYSFRPLKLVERQSLNILDVHQQHSGKTKDIQSSKRHLKSQIQIQSQKQVYYLDENGYLLDEEGYYLLDNQSKMIKASKPMLEKLKEIKMLK